MLRDRLVGAQLRPKSKVTICLMKIQSCTYHGLVHAELLADRVDLLRGRDLPAEDLGGVAAEPVEQEEHEQDDPEQRRDHLPHSA